jgi:hypothetical protein
MAMLIMLIMPVMPGEAVPKHERVLELAPLMKKRQHKKRTTVHSLRG